MTYTYGQFLKHVEAERADAIAWAWARSGTEPRNVDAFAAGFDKGALAAHALLHLHAGVTLGVNDKPLDTLAEREAKILHAALVAALVELRRLGCDPATLEDIGGAITVEGMRRAW